MFSWLQPRTSPVSWVRSVTEPVKRRVPLFCNKFQHLSKIFCVVSHTDILEFLCPTNNFFFCFFGTKIYFFLLFLTFRQEIFPFSTQIMLVQPGFPVQKPHVGQCAHHIFGISVKLKLMLIPMRRTTIHHQLLPHLNR